MLHLWRALHRQTRWWQWRWSTHILTPPPHTHTLKSSITSFLHYKVENIKNLTVFRKCCILGKHDTSRQDDDTEDASLTFLPPHTHTLKSSITPSVHYYISSDKLRTSSLSCNWIRYRFTWLPNRRVGRELSAEDPIWGCAANMGSENGLSVYMVLVSSVG